MKLREKIKNIFRKAGKEARVIKGESSKDKIYTSRHIFEDEISARQFFEESRKRLHQVNDWSHIPRTINSDFTLYSPDGSISVSDEVQLNDYIKIVLPGLFPANWVKVTHIKDGEDFSEFTVSPSGAPVGSGNTEEVKHFFHKKATSTFRVERNDNTIIACEIGKNETVNSAQPEAGNRTVLNTMIAEGGWAGIQKLQWKNLTDYLVGC